jgi:hypothetical protein
MLRSVPYHTVQKLELILLNFSYARLRKSNCAKITEKLDSSYFSKEWLTNYSVPNMMVAKEILKMII